MALAFFGNLHVRTRSGVGIWGRILRFSRKKKLMQFGLNLITISDTIITCCATTHDRTYSCEPPLILHHPEPSPVANTIRPMSATETPTYTPPKKKREK